MTALGLVTGRTPEHEAALDALEGVVRQSLPAPTLHSHYIPSDLGEPVCQLVHAGRMEWTGKSSARFVDPPKPLLSEEQVDGALRGVDIDTRAWLGEYLTSLTQEAE